MMNYPLWDYDLIFGIFMNALVRNAGICMDAGAGAGADTDRP